MSKKPEYFPSQIYLPVQGKSVMYEVANKLGYHFIFDISDGVVEAYNDEAFVFLMSKLKYEFDGLQLWDLHTVAHYCMPTVASCSRVAGKDKLQLKWAINRAGAYVTINEYHRLTKCEILDHDNGNGSETIFDFLGEDNGMTISISQHIYAKELCDMSLQIFKWYRSEDKDYCSKMVLKQRR